MTQSIFPVFISCRKNQDRWPRIHAMCKRIGVTEYLIVYGDTKLSHAYVVTPHLMVLKTPDTYDRLPSKMVRLTRALLQDARFCSYSHIWKIDDDVNLVLNPAQWHRLQHQLHGHYLSPYVNYYYAGREDEYRRYHVGRCHGSSWNTKAYEGEFVPWANGALTYFLDRQAMQHIAEISITETWLDQEIYEDLMVAKQLKQADIEPTVLTWFQAHIEKDIYADES